MYNIFYEVILIGLIYVVSTLLAEIVPLPNSLIGMFILFILLSTKVIKIEKINGLSKWILKYLAFFFIPSAINIINAMELINGQIIKLLAILVISNFLVMGVSGKVVQYIILKEGGQDDD